MDAKEDLADGLSDDGGKDEFTIDLKENHEQFNYEYITHNRVIKLYEDEKKLIIAVDENVIDRQLRNELRHTFREFSVEFKEITAKNFDDMLRKLAKKDEDQYTEGDELKESADDLAKLASDAPTINLVNEIILSAIDQNVSDIHIEAFDNYFKVRYRIDGYLKTIQNYPKHLFNAVVARIKVMSKLDITQKRLSQDGKAQLSFYGKRIDVRTSTVPTIHGESVVLRFLGNEDRVFQLAALGIDEEDIQTCREIINKSYGAFVLTGPTGSGKTTTLRTLLDMMNSDTKNIITVEDPVEYTVEGVNQIQINDKIGFGFSTILRNLLRQDPDVIMIGEMRDLETAELSLQSAMTGHLVLSTLHTNDSISSITRLLHMGIEPYILESSLVGAAAQRLIRVLCNECKEAYKPDHIDSDLLKKYQINTDILYKPKGCPACRNTGFTGRKAFFEVFELSESIKEMIIKRKSILSMREHLINNGFVPIFTKGLRSAAVGEVFLEEVKSTIGEVKI